MNIIYNSNLNGVIGVYDYNNKHLLAYNIKEDIDFFKKQTSSTLSNKPSILIVGYTTYKTLQVEKITTNNRILWVLSRQKKENVNTDNVIFFESYEKLINQYNKQKNKYDNYWIIGGKQIYTLFEPIVEYIFHTEVQHEMFFGNQITYKPASYFKLNKDSNNIIVIDRNTGLHIKIKFKVYKNEFNITHYNNNIKTLDNYYNLNDNLIKINLDESVKTNNKSNKSEEYQYLDLLNKTLKSSKRMTRNGYTYSYFGDQIRFNLVDGFPLLTTKNMFFKGILYELLFFISGSTNTKLLEDVGVNIWKGNTSREFLDNNGYNDYLDGEMGPMYGYQWRYFNGKIDQLNNVLDEIVNNPSSRRLLLTTFNPEQVSQGVLYPCHSLITQLYVDVDENHNHYISMSMYQRSADIFLGLPFNIASTALFLEIICHYLNNKTKTNKYIAKDIIISLGDIHLYETHVEQALEQLRRTPLQFCKLKIKNSYNKIDEYLYEDFVLEDYLSYPSIKANMVA